MRIEPSPRGYLEADIRVRLPDGTHHRERRRAPSQVPGAALRWAQARERHLIAGHADIKTTMRYAHLSPAHKSDAIKLLEQPVTGAGTEQAPQKG